MKIKFLNRFSCELAVGIEGDEPDFEDETFGANEIHDVDVLDEDKDTYDVQFGDSSVLYRLPKCEIEVIAEY